ncbi:MAG: hypothetical protein R3C68_16625 [Myxococcota bacterium]
MWRRSPLGFLTIVTYIAVAVAAAHLAVGALTLLALVALHALVPRLAVPRVEESADKAVALAVSSHYSHAQGGGL